MFNLRIVDRALDAEEVGDSAFVNLKSETLGPELDKRYATPKTRNSKPCLASAGLQGRSCCRTCSVWLWWVDQNLGTQNPDPETRNRKPKTNNLETGFRNPRPGTRTTETQTQSPNACLGRRAILHPVTAPPIRAWSLLRI